MENAIKAITKQQGQIIFEHLDSNNIEQHLEDLDTIFYMTIAKIKLRRLCR